MSKGRGSLFELIRDSSSKSCSGQSGDDETPFVDSGIPETTLSSRGSTRLSSRGKLLEELASSCSNLSLGRGRANLFKTLRDNSITDASSKPTKISIENVESKQVEVEVQPPKYFQPENRQGKVGTKIRLACNYIPLECDKTKGVFVYEVRFVPSVDSFNLRIKYINEHRSILGNTKTFDGVILYLPILLENKLTTLLSTNVADGSDIEIRILFKREESLKNCIHLYNVLFDRVMKSLKYVKFNRKQFDPTAPKIIPQAKLEIWPGYVTAVDEYDGGLLLCCDVSHRLLCQKSVLEFLADIYNIDCNNFQDKAKKSLIGSVVITRYNNRTYRIDDICFDQSPKSTFKTRDKDVSYIEYYRTNHNIDIKDINQPLLMSLKTLRKSDKNETEELIFCLIPELCYLTGLQDSIRDNHSLMREIATFTRVAPNQRMQALEKFYKNINDSPEAHQILKNWGLSLKKHCIQVSGRQMQEEQIIFAKKTFCAGPNADFSKYAAKNEMLEIVNLRNWILIYCKNNTRQAESFCEHLKRTTGGLGMTYQPPKLVLLNSDRVDSYVNALRSNIRKDTDIVVCICPTNRDDRYSAIKKICCTEIPIPSQVINGKTLSNEMKNRSICQQILLQMNCKLGGTLWSVKIPFKNVMICGIDSYHDPAQKLNSVAAFVASLNPQYTKWHSRVVLQTKREEIVNGLCTAFIAALNEYEVQNKKLPDNIIIYRDGVGDGQLPLCLDHEVPQFDNAIRAAFSHSSIKITFIVVQKRINTRFFVLNNENYENPMPGTVLDHTITRRNMYDFFLVSQSIRQGTVSPVHFIVIRDDGNYNPDILQRLSYKLCFLYYNWPGTIRVPACCQYAHKLAFLIGQSVRRVPAEQLLNKLFYL